MVHLRIQLILTLSFAAFPLLSQTIAVENQNLMNKYLSEEFTQILNISCEYRDYVNNRSVSGPLSSFFPITDNPQEEWKPIIMLVNETSNNLDAMVDLVAGYVGDYENDYNW